MDANRAAGINTLPDAALPTPTAPAVAAPAAPPTPEVLNVLVSRDLSPSTLRASWYNF